MTMPAHLGTFFHFRFVPQLKWDAGTDKSFHSPSLFMTSIFFHSLGKAHHVPPSEEPKTASRDILERKKNVETIVASFVNKHQQQKELFLPQTTQMWIYNRKLYVKWRTKARAGKKLFPTRLFFLSSGPTCSTF